MKYERVGRDDRGKGEINIDQAISQIKSADVLVIHPAMTALERKNSQKELLSKLIKNYRSPEQLITFFQIESPALIYNDMTAFNGIFNKTVTYRRDSDYIGNFPFPTRELFGWLKTRAIETLPQKKYGVLAVISNCDSVYRNKLVSDLTPLLKLDNGTLSLDLLGKCSVKEQIGRSEDSETRLKQSGLLKHLANKNNDVPYGEYKFYLSFENARGKGYISEKFLNPIRIGTVPIVAGAPREDYEKIVPGGAFIHVDDFESVEKLADHINFLVGNDEAYFEYFDWWRTDNLTEWSRLYEAKQFWNGGKSGDSVWCDVCRDAYEARQGKLVQPAITDMQGWWNGHESQDCHGAGTQDSGAPLESLE